MAEEQILYTGNDVQFIEGITCMSQSNWQKYFGSAFENKILSGLYPVTVARSGGLQLRIYNGAVNANGIFGQIKSQDGYIEIPYSSPGNGNYRFICARLYTDEERLEIVSKVDYIGTDYSTLSTAVANFYTDEAYQCERDANYYEFPIYYENGIAALMNLSRRYFHSNQYRHIASLNSIYGLELPTSTIGNGTYVIDNWDDPETYPDINVTDYIALDWWNLEDTYVYIKRNGGKLYIQSMPWIDVGCNNAVKANNTLYNFPKITCEIRGSHLSTTTGNNWACAVFNNPANDNTKCLHIRKLYEDQNDVYLAHYLIEELY